MAGKGKGNVISEMIGRVARPIARVLSMQTVDVSAPDYGFWARIRRGKQKTYELGGLFAKPITETIASFVLGKGLGIDCEDADTAGVMSEFVSDHLDDFIQCYEDSMALGDAYIAINADGSLTRLSADTVEILCDPPGSQNVIGYKVTTRLPDRTVTDVYTRRDRTVTVKTVKATTVNTYANPTGEFLIIHFPNDPEANELYGHPIYETLLKLFSEYDDSLTKSLDGVKAMGHPVPVIEDAENPDAEIESNKTGDDRYVDADGNTQSRPVIDISRLTMLVLGKGAKFKFAQPGAFTQDSGRMLEFLFLLMLQHSRVPEWAWGGAVASSKASVDAQAPAFHLFIEGRRRKLERVLLRLMKVWRMVNELYNPLVDAAAKLGLDWGELSEADKAVMLTYITSASDRGWLSDETALALTGLVDDPAAEIEKASAQKQDNEAAFDARIRSALNQPDTADPNADEAAA